MRDLDFGHFSLVNSDLYRLFALISLRICQTRSYPRATKSSPAGSCLTQVIRFLNWRCFNLLQGQSRNPVAGVQLAVFFRMIGHYQSHLISIVSMKHTGTATDTPLYSKTLWLGGLPISPLIVLS